MVKSDITNPTVVIAKILFRKEIFFLFPGEIVYTAIAIIIINKNINPINPRIYPNNRSAISDEVMSLDNVTTMFNCTIEEAITKDDKLGEIRIKNHEMNETTEISIKALFVAIGVEPQSEIAKKVGIETDEYNFIKVNKKQETNIPGIYAAGDITGGIRQVSTAVGEATTAAMNAYLFIKKGWYGEGAS